MTREPIMKLLKDATAAQHAHAESRPLERALVEGSLPRCQFVAYLEQRLLIHKSLERAVRALCASDPRFADLVPDALYQEANLRRDLAFFGVETDAIEARAATQRLLADIEAAAHRCPAGLLGFYYVFEGSKNGARFIARAVGATYEIEPGPGLLYLDPHGKEQRALWLAFKERMNALPLTEEEREAMVTAAGLAFDRVSELDDEMHSEPVLAD